MKRLSIVVLSLFYMISCSPRERQFQEEFSLFSLEESNQQAFVANLARFCGQSFAGRQVFIAEGRESWAERSMTMHVSLCEGGHIHIPFHMDEDHSRTWMFIQENGRLRFRHDHRHPDGTPEDVTLYGGYADALGTPFTQNFPADEFTCETIPPSCNATWTVSISPDLTTFSYQLKNFGELLFQADFNLANPL
jgi:hypothetical protein